MEFRGNDVDQSTIEEISKELVQFKGGCIELRKEDFGIARILLNRPEKRNALSGEMLVQLLDAIRDLEQWSDGRGVIICSPGNCFCAGLDLNMVRQLGSTLNGGRDLTSFLHHVACRLEALPLVSVAVIQGKVIGGGAELVTACDFRLLNKDSEISFVHARMGVTTVFGGGTRLVRMLGHTKALKILLSAVPISAKEALNLGLADDFVVNKDPDPSFRCREASLWVAQYIGCDRQVARAMKSMVSAAATKRFEESLATEREMFLSVWGGPAHQEAMQNSGKPKL